MITMNVKILIPVIIIIILIIGIIALAQNTEQVDNQELKPDDPQIEEKMQDIEKKSQDNQYTPKDREWITSGPFQIDRSQYILGEKIFIRMGGLSDEDKGQVAFLRPSNETHYSVYQTIPFDGKAKPAFNYYVEADLSATKGICSIKDLVGDWRVVFRGTDYPNLEFKVTDKIIPGEEKNYEPVC